MVKCNQCGKENRPGGKFCGACGAPFLTQSPVQAPPPPPVSPPPPPGGNYSGPPPVGFRQGFQQTAGNPAEKTAKLGWKRSHAAIVCYVFGWLSGIIMYFVEPDPFVRFHAVQSTMVFFTLMILNMFLPYSLTSIFSIVGFALWVFLIFKASKGELFKLPLIGSMAETFVTH
ncbi:MAG: hypothetical protein AWM53_00642 [Candidatus Dichloromethanomonas elyunquensis]|nr:MAG: hypothetical protein AWM53_00642 [Candidatus Dichloromethanomonas elyunquensis]